MPQSPDMSRSASGELRKSETMDGAVVEKICVICGENVAGRPRLKDREGRYFCIECGEADSERKHSVGTPCTDCKKKFPDNQLQLHNEQPVCEECLTKRHQAERDAARRLRAQQEEEEERKARKLQLIIGIAVVVIAVAAYFVIF